MAEDFIIAPALLPLCVPMGTLYPDPSNFNVHPDENIQAIKDSLTQYGQVKPIVVNGDGMIVAGNGTYEAAFQLGASEIAVVRIGSDYMDGDELRLFGISDNATSKSSYFDEARLSAFVAEALAVNPLASIPGFTDQELKEMASGVKTITTPEGPTNGETSGKSGEGDFTPEKAPERVNPGELWKLGNHYILCGDLTNVDNLATVCEYAGVNGFDVVFADPPYGQEYQSNFKQDKFDKIVNDDTYIDMATVYDNIKDGGSIYVCTRWDHYPHWFSEADEYVQVKNCVIWHKPGGGLGDLESAYIFNHEFLIYGVKGKHILRGKRESDVWTISKDAGTTYMHPTQKPIQLAEKVIAKSSNPGDWVFEPFGGSGPALLASERMGRYCVSADLMPGYCDVMIYRWEAETGKSAELVTEGIGV